MKISRNLQLLACCMLTFSLNSCNFLEKLARVICRSRKKVSQDPAAATPRSTPPARMDPPDVEAPPASVASEASSPSDNSSESSEGPTDTQTVHIKVSTPTIIHVRPSETVSEEDRKDPRISYATTVTLRHRTPSPLHQE